MTGAREPDERLDKGAEARARRWSFGPAVLDERTLELTVNGSVINLERKPLEVLLCLLHRAGEVVTKDEILEAVWPGRILSDTVLMKAIGRIREALGDEAQTVIKTQHGYGYRLVAPVSVEAAPIAAPPRFDFKPGDSPPLRPRWKLEQRLGTGGHGEAWLARHEKTREARVYKFALDSTALGSLKREITIYRLLREALPERSDFVEVLDWNLEEPPCFLEIERAGLDLVAWADKQGGLTSVPLDARLEIAAQVAEALAAAHSVGVLHKDLKPSNVLVTGDTATPRIKLADFGSGGVLDPQRLEALGITRLGFTKTVKTDPTTSGTPVYFAPEVIAGQPFTTQADIYALGVMLFQLVVGDLRRPLATGWERDVADEILREDITAATDGSLARRIADAVDLGRRLRLLAQRRVQREAERASYEQAQRARLLIERMRARRRWLYGLTTVFAIGLITSTTLYFFAQASREDAERSAATTQAVIRFLTSDVLSPDDRDTGLARTDMTIRQALDHAAKKVNERFGSKPEVAARVHLAIGSAYGALGDDAAAREQLERARALEADVEGPLPDWMVPIVFLRSFTHEEGPFSGEACSRLEQAVRAGIRETSFPNLMREIRMMVAFCRIQEGSYDQARQELASLLAEALAVEPPDFSTALSIESGLAGLSYIQGDILTAERYARDEYAHAVAATGPRHHRTVTPRLNRITPLAILGRFDEAERELAEVRAFVTDEYPDTQRISSTLATLRFEQGRFDEAEKELEAYLRQLKSKGGSRVREQLVVTYRLGAIHIGQGRIEQAIAILRPALEEGASLAVQDPLDRLSMRNELLRAQTALADAYRLADDLPSARKALAAAEARARELPDRHPWLADLRRVAGLLHDREGRFVEASAALREAVEICELRFGPDSPRTRRAREELARLLGKGRSMRGLPDRPGAR